jgi:hypothetical protein
VYIQVNKRVGALFLTHQVTIEYAEETNQQIANGSAEQEIVEAVLQLGIE